MVEDDSTWDVGKDGTAIFVDGEEEVAARVQCEARDVLSVGEREGVGLGAAGVSDRTFLVHQPTYFTRSNMETRLPTGESRDVPSGVKSRFPLL